MLTTGVISQSAAQFMRGRAVEWLRRLWWLPASVLTATIVLGCMDPRFWYVLAIELFLIFPGVMVPVVLGQIMGPCARRATWPHTLSLDDSSLTLTYLSRCGRDGDEYPLPKPEKYAWTDFSAYQDAGESVILVWADSRLIPLQLPADSFDSQQWIEAAALLTKHLKRL